MTVLKSVICPVLIGRAPTVEFLRRAMDSAGGGKGQMVILAGEAGIGKSRLVAEAKSHAAQAGFATLQGNCFEQDRGFPYAPWIDALRTFFARRDADTLRGQLGVLASELIKLLPELKLILPDAPLSAALDLEAEKRRLFEALAQFLTRLSNNQPLLLILEDLHWSDEASLELLHFIARRIVNYPILLLATYRSDQVPGQLGHRLAQFDRERLANEIALSPLTRDETVTMVQAVLGSERRFEANLLDRIVPLAEGNPFFVEELCKSLVEAGDVFYADSTWQHKSASDLHIPRSVRDAMQRRTEQLSAGTRDVLVLAAVAGHRFDFGLLQALTQMNEPDLVACLRELMAAQLVVEESVDGFAFRHALTREAVYAMLLARERRALHQRVAETLERFAHARAETLDRHLAQLAYHSYEAGLWDKAFEYSQRAGERAQALYATREALVQFTRALDAAQHLSVRPPVPVLLARAQTYATNGEFERARADYEAALEQVHDGQDRRAEWQALLGLGFLWTARDYVRSVEFFERALDAARILEDAPALGQTLNRVGNLRLNQDQPDSALPYHAEALRLFEATGDLPGQAETHELLAVTYYTLADVVKGIQHDERALELARRANHRLAEYHAAIHLLLPLQADTEVCEPYDAERLIRLGDSAVAMAREMNWRAGEAQALGLLSFFFGARGDYVRAFADSRHAHGLVTPDSYRPGMSAGERQRGQLALDLLDPLQAQQHLERAITFAQESGARMFENVAWSLLARALIQSGKRDDVSRAQAILDAMQGGDLPARTRTSREIWFVRAELALARREADAALQILDSLMSSTANIERHGSSGVPRLAHLRGAALLMLGRLDEAERVLREARDGAIAQGRKPMLWRIHTRLGQVYLAQKRRADAEHEFAQAREIIQDLASNVLDAPMRDNFYQRALTMIPVVPSPTARQIAKRAYDGLTARERQVAALIAQGKSNREIAEALVITERTTERHVTNILSKLGFNARTQIAAWAVEKGLARARE